MFVSDLLMRPVVLFDQPEDGQGAGGAAQGGETTPPAETPPVAESQWVPPTEAEVKAMQSAIANERRGREAAEKLVKAEADKKAEEEGRWKELAESSRAEAEEARAALAAFQNELAIEAKARDLKFRRPDDALKLLPDDVDRTDAVAVEAGLKALLANDPALLADDKPQPTGAQPGGAAPPQSLDEQIAEAEQKGDWSTAGALKAQKALSGHSDLSAAAA